MPLWNVSLSQRDNQFEVCLNRSTWTLYNPANELELPKLEFACPSSDSLASETEARQVESPLQRASGRMRFLVADLRRGKRGPATLSMAGPLHVKPKHHPGCGSLYLLPGQDRRA